MKSIILSSLVLSASLVASVGAATIEVEVPAKTRSVPESATTRAEVLADLTMWRLAGLQQLTQSERYGSPETEQYRQGFATYLELRASPQFAALVKQLQQESQRFDRCEAVEQVVFSPERWPARTPPLRPIIERRGGFPASR